ncbi:MAG: hypothetical protein OXC61_02670 [Flavobacteriaceae bacterium]|nr:hypothetical protein [Flavobacteriaceae bacterium]
MNFIEHFKSILLQVDQYHSDGELLKNRIVEDALKLDVELIGLLHNDERLRDKFFTKIQGGGNCI